MISHHRGHRGTQSLSIRDKELLSSVCLGALCGECKDNKRKAYKTMTQDEKYISRCIQLAKNGLCNTPPNPMVGAVISQSYGRCRHRISGPDYRGGLSRKMRGRACRGECHRLGERRKPIAPIYAIRELRALLTLWEDPSMCRPHHPERHSTGCGGMSSKSFGMPALM